MYYVDFLAMTASYLKPSMNSFIGVARSRNEKRFLLQKKNQHLIKLCLASICLFFCIVLVPEKPTNLASVCEKYNSAAACQVW